MTTKQAKKVRRFKHAPRLLFEMCRASQEGLAASDWQRLMRQKRHAELAEAFAKYAPDAKTPRGIGWALKDLCGQKFEHDDEEFELVSRWFSGDSTHRYGVRAPLRERIIATRERKKAREESNLETAKIIARQLRRGEPVADVLDAINGTARAQAESISERSTREAVEVSRASGWIPPAMPARKAPPSPVAIDPEPIAPPADMSDWPPAWRKYGRPSYVTAVRETPDDSFLNAAPSPPSAAECGAPSLEYPRSPLPK